MERENLDRNFGFILNDVSRLMRTTFDRRAKSIGLTRSQWWVLTHLYRRDGLVQAEMAEILEIERATLGRLLARGAARLARPLERLRALAEPQRVHQAVERAPRLAGARRRRRGRRPGSRLAAAAGPRRLRLLALLALALGLEGDEEVHGVATAHAVGRVGGEALEGGGHGVVVVVCVK